MNQTGDIEDGKVMEHRINIESKVGVFLPELFNEVNPSENLRDCSNVAGDIEDQRMMEHGINTESKVVAFSPELLNEVNPSENLPDSSNVSGDIEHRRVMEPHVNIGTELLNEVSLSEILSDSSSVSGDIEHGRLMKHSVNSSENSPDSSSVSGETDFLIFKKAVEHINEKIRGLPPLLPEPCIFKVPEGLRKVNQKAYTPILVSIGPYHHKKSNLRAMEEHKLRYFQSLVQRVGQNNATFDIGFCIFIVEQMVDKAQDYYADPICMEKDEFLEMLLLDACFIIEFLRKLYIKGLRDKDDPIFNSSWMRVQICRDLMLLENQIPFFVLSEISLRASGESFEFLNGLQYFPIRDMLPRRYSFEKAFQQIFVETSLSTCDVKHFLHLLHILYVPTFERPDSGGHEVCKSMSSVTELQEAGIRFNVYDSDDVSIFDISFEHGHMKLPKFRVTDTTETFFRNIVAYEQHCSSDEPKYFTDYRYFMDLVINTGKDVNALRLCKIMDNMLGDDEEVATMFNRMGDGVLIEPTFYYSHICQKVNHHCDQPWNKAMARLRRNYFYNRWASISTVAAGVLLLLTLIQTAVALIALFLSSIGDII